jgi:hypothetical protein
MVIYAELIGRLSQWPLVFIPPQPPYSCCRGCGGACRKLRRDLHPTPPHGPGVLPGAAQIHPGAVSTGQQTASFQLCALQRRPQKLCRYVTHLLGLTLK